MHPGRTYMAASVVRIVSLITTHLVRHSQEITTHITSFHVDNKPVGSILNEYAQVRVELLIQTDIIII